MRALSGKNTWPASIFAEATDMRAILSRSGSTAMIPEIWRLSSCTSDVPVPLSSTRILRGFHFFAARTTSAFSVG